MSMALLRNMMIKALFLLSLLVVVSGKVGQAKSNTAKLRQAKSVLSGAKNFVQAVHALSKIPSLISGNKREFKLINHCGYKIWPGWWAENGIPNGGGTTLNAGASKTIRVPNNWSTGRICARTGCDGKFNCETGGCGNSERCDGKTGETGVTLAGFNLKKIDGNDFYHVSLIDGFNVQIRIKPFGGNGYCQEIGRCSENLLHSCPNGLKVYRNGRTVKCESACTKTGNPAFCCTGYHNRPETCPPSNFSRFFKDRCHDSYSHFYED
uniref:Thaumatin-like protein n=1 Tax=Panagrellus redivivus TaxID=6233 RepID=A0A7E4USC1_PANRE